MINLDREGMHPWRPLDPPLYMLGYEHIEHQAVRQASSVKQSIKRLMQVYGNT